ncbi:protein kinase domain-containing protein [Mycolicibacter sinensis]|uniref:protein kinase domain-containing protein n=1 Tax=Mycolicibacter sinensis (strain JDM601) TaxID=875328 RepID=UPI0002F366CE
MEGTPFGRYQLVEVLGRGGMGEVWRGFDTVTERTVAVKVLPAHLAGDEGFQQRFLREAKAAASLNEPHVVPIHDFGEIDGRLFVAMRLVDGQDLQDLLAHGPLSPDRAVTIIEQVASALDAAHRIGLVHRDVKPSNILVTEDDFAYLIDFGIARVAGETGLTSTGMTLGTWPYMAPERFRTGTADARSDVYALTCVLHQALTGQQPFPGEALEQVAAGHMFEPPPLPSAIRPSVPAAMDNVIATGMAKEPDERYATPKDLAQAARAALPGPVSHATIAAAGAATLAATAPGLHEAPTRYAPTEPPPVPSAASAVRASDEPPRRPPTVIAALLTTGLALVLLLLLGAFSLMPIIGPLDGGSKFNTIMCVIGLESLITAALVGWGAVAAIKGATPKGLLYAPVVLVALLALAILVGLALGEDSWQPTGLLLLPLILLSPGSLLVMTSSSEDFFEARSRGRAAE